MSEPMLGRWAAVAQPARDAPARRTGQRGALPLMAPRFRLRPRRRRRRAPRGVSGAASWRRSSGSTATGSAPRAAPTASRAVSPI